MLADAATVSDTVHARKQDVKCRELKLGGGLQKGAFDIMDHFHEVSLLNEDLLDAFGEPSMIFNEENVHGRSFARSFLVWMLFSLYYTREGQENHENFPIQFTGSLKKQPLYSSRYLLIRCSVTPHITFARGGHEHAENSRHRTSSCAGKGAVYARQTFHRGDPTDHARAHRRLDRSFNRLIRDRPAHRAH